MNLVGGAMRTTKAAVDAQAFKTGEKIGEHLKLDQESDVHSVQTKIQAANEGLKDSVADGVSMLQTGVAEAAKVMDDKDVQEEIFVAVDPVRTSPQFNYFNQLMETFGKNAEQMVNVGLDQAQAKIKDQKTKDFIANAKRSFNEGRNTEQAKLEEIAAKDEQVDSAKIEEQKKEIHEKMDGLIEKAGAVTKLGMDAGPVTLKVGSEEAEKAVSKLEKDGEEEAA